MRLVQPLISNSLEPGLTVKKRPETVLMSRLTILLLAIASVIACTSLYRPNRARDSSLTSPDTYIHELQFDGPVYLSLDLDCLDPAFAPGVSHHEPGGLSTREVLSIIQNFRGNLVGADIVELNPERDSTGITSMVAAKLQLPYS